MPRDVWHPVVKDFPLSNVWDGRSSDWHGWYFHEEEGSGPGQGPAEYGAAYISNPGAALDSNDYIGKTNDTDRDICTILGRLNGQAGKYEFDGAVSRIVTSKLRGNKTTAKLKLSFNKYAYEKTPTSFDVKVYINRQGLTPTLAATESTIPAVGQDERPCSINVDLSSYITADDLYEIWIQADIVAVNDASVDYKTYAVWFNPVSLSLSFDESFDTTTATTIKIGSTATAWGSLAETTLENVTPLSLQMDYRGASTFVWEADPVDTHLSADSYAFKRVQLEIGGTVRFRGRVQTVQGVGDPSAERYRFTCTDFRGNGKNVQIEKDPANTPTIALRIYNAEADDPDFNKCEATGQTVGEIIQDLIDTHKTIMLAEDALYSTTPVEMYVAAELAQLDHIPGKIAFREMNIIDGIQRALAEMGKAFAMYVDQVDGIYHFYQIRDNGTAREIDVEADEVRDSIDHSVEECYTALSLYGALGAGETIKKQKIGIGGYDGTGNVVSGLVKEWDTSLEPENAGDWDLAKYLGERDYCVITGKSPAPSFSWVYDTSKAWEADFWIGGKVMFPKLGNTTYEITDSVANGVKFTHGMGASPLYDVDIGDQFFLIKETDYGYVFRLFSIDNAVSRDIIEGGEFSGIDCCPRLYVYGFVNDDPAQGLISKQAIPIRIIKESFSTVTTDYNNPPYILTQYPLYKGDDTYVYVGAEDFALEYCHRHATAGVELRARYPEEQSDGDLTYTGKAYTVHGIEREKALIVSEFKDADDEGAFETLAEELLKPYKDPRTSGTITLPGIDWDYADLYSLIDLTHAGQSTPDIEGVSLIGVRYDFLSYLTVLTLSNDFREGFNYSNKLDRFVKGIRDQDDLDSGVSREDYIRCSRGQVMGETTPGPLDENLDIEYHGPSAPVWGDFQSGSFGTRCDTQTYKSDGSLGPVSAQMNLCTSSMYGQSYYVTTGTKGKLHGVVLRPGSGAGGSDDANTHLFYPYICMAGHEPTTSLGRCGVGGFKQIEIVVPEATPANRANMADFLPIFLRCYANFIQFTSQGMACMDDRIYRLDQHLWGTIDPGVGNNLIHRICMMVKKCVVFLAEAISDIDNHYSWKAAIVEENCSGGHCGGFCRMIVSCGPAIGPLGMESKVNYKDDPVCSPGEESEDCCTAVRIYNPPELV